MKLVRKQPEVRPEFPPAEPAPMEAARIARGHAQHLAGELGPRPAGSAAERAALDYAESILRSLGLQPQRQQFWAMRSAWLPFLNASLIALIGIGLWLLLGRSLLATYLGALGCGFALWEVYARLNFGWTPVTGLAPRTQSGNVYAVVPPAESEGRHAVLFAHVDTQRTPLFSRSRGTLLAFLVVFYIGFAILALTLVALVASWFAELVLPAWAGLPAICVCLLAAAAMLQAELSPHTPGANDNASSVGLALALAQCFQKAPLRHTKLWFVFTGAEETGCAGAAAFLDGVAEELMQAYVIALEGVGAAWPSYSLREGMLRRYRSNSELIRLAERVSRSKPELRMRPVRLPIGYTEAGQAAKKGYRSLAIVGTDERGYLPYWHTPKDDPSHLQEECLAAAYDAVVQLLRELDQLPVSIKLSAVKPLSQRS
jgi:hypothetical protein